MEKLKTRNVFLDVKAFRSGGFNYRSFRTLAELAVAGEVHVFTTDITAKEVKAFEQKAYTRQIEKSRRRPLETPGEKAQNRTPT
jgi:hypothetical protein